MTFTEYLQKVDFADPKITYEREMRLRRKLYIAIEGLNQYVEDAYMIDGVDIGSYARDTLDVIYEREPQPGKRRKPPRKRKRGRPKTPPQIKSDTSST